MICLRRPSPVYGLDLVRLLDDARDDPPLAAAERTRLRDVDGVTRLGRVVRVVREERRRSTQRLAVDRMPLLTLHGDDDGLVHLVADDRASELCFRAHIRLLTLHSRLSTSGRAPS